MKCPRSIQADIERRTMKQTERRDEEWINQSSKGKKEKEGGCWCQRGDEQQNEVSRLKSQAIHPCTALQQPATAHTHTTPLGVIGEPVTGIMFRRSQHQVTVLGESGLVSRPHALCLALCLALPRIGAAVPTHFPLLPSSTAAHRSRPLFSEAPAPSTRCERILHSCNRALEWRLHSAALGSRHNVLSSKRSQAGSQGRKGRRDLDTSYTCTKIRSAAQEQSNRQLIGQQQIQDIGQTGSL